MTTTTSEHRRPTTLAKWLLRGLAALVVIVLLLAAFVTIKLRGSLPILEGRIELTGTQSEIRIERDESGVPTINGSSRADLAFALGFLHAQERFFQMDLMRRQGGGELAELFGEKAIETDKRSRIHRFRHRAVEFVSALEEEKRDYLLAYTNGVNSGLAQMSEPPFEYLLLGQEPVAWRPEDTYLCVYTMYILLQSSDGHQESNLALMHDLLPQSLVEFLTPLGTSWDAAIDRHQFAKPALPEPAEYFTNPTDATAQAFANPPPASNFLFDLSHEMQASIGSNNWAVSGKLTKHGGAIVADDMHLPLRLPNTWYRASLVRASESGKKTRMTGVTLPGVPNVITGSTDNVAWGYTNAFGDWGDLILLELDPEDENRYLTADGYKEIQTATETISVKDGNDVELEVDETIWGPVYDLDHLGHKRVYRWVAHLEDAVNLNLVELDEAENVEQALDIAHRSGIPAQNFVAGDRYGNIAWTIIGAIPKRFGFDGRLPQSWADGTKGWHGWLEPAAYPRVVNPESGRIWSANARVVGGKMFAGLYDGYYVLGARAQQIRDDLFAKDRFVETDMLAIQRDNRAVFLTRWQELLMNLLDESALDGQPERAEFRRLLQAWEGKASVTSVGYRLTKLFRTAVSERVFPGLFTAVRKADPRFKYMSSTTHQFEQPLWDMVTLQPDYLVAPSYPSWRDLLLDQVDKVISGLDRPLADRTWGEMNTVSIRHPFGQALPMLSKWLDIPARQLPGDWDMPFVQAPLKGAIYGASERYAVSPGREDDAYFQMPGGQSAHPLSPFYNKDHEVWLNGEVKPFLPGEMRYQLEIVPSTSAEQVTIK